MYWDKNSVFPYICSMNLRWKIAQAVEIKWWKNYLKDKNKQEYLSWKQNYWQQFLEKTALKPEANARVLDAGCGPAGIFIILTQQDVTAIDPLLDRYAETLPQFNMADYPTVDFRQTSLEDFESEQGYDYIFCLNAINHVADINVAMDHLISVLKPGGKIVLSIDAHNHAWLKRLFRWLPGDILHPHQYDLEEYRAMLMKRGCEINSSFLQKKEWIFNYHVMVATK